MKMPYARHRWKYDSEAGLILPTRRGICELQPVGPGIFSGGGTLAAPDVWASTIRGLSPVWWLRFKETTGSTFADSSGNGLNGTLSSGTVAAYNQSALFPKTDPCLGSVTGFSSPVITVPDNALLDITGDFTVMAIFKTPSATQTNYAKLVWKPTDILNGRGTYYLALDAGSFTLRARVNISSAYYDVTSPTQLSPSTTYMVFMRRIGTELSLWIGNPSAAPLKIATTTLPTGAVLDTAALPLGVGGPSGADTFNGLFTDTALFAGGLNDASIASVWAAATQNTDMYFSSVVSLLHFNSGVADTAGHHSWTQNSVAVDALQKMFGAGSLDLFSGGTLTTPDSADFAQPGDFTYEVWLYPTAIGATRTFWGPHTGTSPGGTIFYMTGGVPRIGKADVGDVLVSGTALTANAWTHFAASRIGSTLRLFQNGVITATGTDTTSYTGGGGSLLWGFGDNAGGGNPYAGWQDEFRLTKGIGRYSTAFTPTGPFFDQ